MSEILLFIYLIGVFTAVIIILKHYNLLYPVPEKDLETEETLRQHILSILHETPCPLCNSNTSLISVNMPLRQNKTAVLKCENPKCQQQSIWEYEKNRWTLKAPFKFSFTPKTILPVLPIKPEIEQPKKEEKELSITFA